MEEIIGMILDDYKVIEYVGKLNPKRSDKYYKLKCTICGEERISPKTLKVGFSKHTYEHNEKTCADYFRQIEVGKVYGDYKVIKFIETKNNNKLYKVKCNICSREKEVYLKHLKNGKGISHQSCIKTLNGVDKRFYEIWSGMIKRTTNPNAKAYVNYGGRGITADKYKLFIDFYDDMFESYKEHCKIHGEENTSLDRIDVNDNYTKENLRWATKKIQNRNTRKQLKTCTAIDRDGNKYEFNCAKEFAEAHNMNATYIYNVLNGRQKTYNGWIFYRN